MIKSYARIYTINNLKISLFKNGPCLIAFPVYNYGDNFWIANNDTLIGGHAVILVGYNKDGFIVRNSWGQNWGDKGYSIYKFQDWGSHWEIWSTIDLEKDVNYKPNKKEIECCKIL